MDTKICGPVASVTYTDIVDPNRKWYNNKRCVLPTWNFILLRV